MSLRTNLVLAVAAVVTALIVVLAAYWTLFSDGAIAARARPHVRASADTAIVGSVVGTHGSRVLQELLRRRYGSLTNADLRTAAEKARSLSRTCVSGGALDESVDVLKRTLTFARREQAALHLGFTDSEFILPVLALFYTPDRRLSMDIGSNRGDTSAMMMNLLVPPACDRGDDAIKSDGSADTRASVPAACTTRVFAFEPVPPTFDQLRQRGQDEGWDAQGWRGIHAAVSDKDGTAVFFWSGQAGDRQASLDRVAAGGSHALNVRSITVDTFLAELPDSERTAPGFLMKIDAEGFDPLVLDGAAVTLLRRQFKFVQFEYNAKWFHKANPYTLQRVAKRMYGIHYRCYLMTIEGFIPLFDRWWQPAFEIRDWSNVLCGGVDDPDMDAVVALMTPSNVLVPPICGAT